MEGTSADGWEAELGRWLEPFLARLRRKEQRRWAPFYLKGLILPGERKSIEPMAARVAPGDLQQLHHFVSTSPWATAPLEDELVHAADRLVGGPDAVLVVDDTALVKQGRRSVGVKRQYCGQLGKRANCQALVSLTLARAGVPVGVGLRLFLPEDWGADAARRAAVGVPEAVGYRPKWKIALDEIDRVLAAGARFGAVLADAEYGKAGEFRAGVGERRHQQLKDELGLDHFEGRSWRGLHHHALLCLLAFAFLQHLRLGGKKRRHPARARAAAPAEPARRAPRDRGRTDPRAPLLPALSAALRAPPPAMTVAG